MAWSGSGTFLRDYNWTADAAAAIPIRADRMDGEFANYKGGLENCLTRTGETPPLTNISWSNFKITNLGNASSSKDALNVLTAQNSGYIWGGTTTGAANVYDATLSPPITAYSTGMVVRVLTHQANTGAATLNLNGVGAIGILTAKGSALSTGDIPIGLAEFLYDGTNFRIIGVLSSTTINEVQSGSLFWGGTSTGAANVYDITPSPALVAYAAGNRFWFITHQANTGAATLNVNGLGVKSLLNRNGIALVPGQIPNGTLLDVSYDGTNFRIVDGIPWVSIEAQTQGDLPYWGTSGLPAILPAGTSGQFLQTRGAAANPVWAGAINTITVQLYTASGTWNKPSGLLYAEVYAQGAGGNGTLGPPSTTGAGGGCAIKTIDAASLGATETVTVSAGTASFGAHCTGTPGSGITSGNASGGDLNIPGQGGFTSGTAGNNYVQAHGGNSMLGMGGYGTSGKGYGGGGGHNSAGAPAAVLVYEYRSV